MSRGSSDVLQYDGTTGDFIGSFFAAPGPGLPEDILFASDGNVYVTSDTSNSVLPFDLAGNLLGPAFIRGGHEGLDNPNGLLEGPGGVLYVSSQESDEVLTYQLGTTPTFDFYKFTVEDNDGVPTNVIIDIDTAGLNPNTDAVVYLLNEAGGLIDMNDDASPFLGGTGSDSRRDSYLEAELTEGDLPRGGGGSDFRQPDPQRQPDGRG